MYKRKTVFFQRSSHKQNKWSIFLPIKIQVPSIITAGNNYSNNYVIYYDDGYSFSHPYERNKYSAFSKACKQLNLKMKTKIEIQIKNKRSDKYDLDHI